MKKFMVLFVLSLCAQASLFAGGQPDPAAEQAAPPPQQPAPVAAPAPVAPAAPKSPYFDGDGGAGKSLAVLAPKGAGLAKDQGYLPALVQGEFVSNFSGFSAISVLDRERLDDQYAELLSGYYDEKDKAGFDLGHLSATDYIMGGSITKTATGYALQMQITKTADKMTAASYSGTCTFAELDNLTGIRKASLDLLQKMGVSLTAQSKSELQRAATQQSIQGQTALAQGIAAQRSGTTVEALAYYYQAAVFDPSLLEAASRKSVMTANISSGNIGDDTRNDIAWRKGWLARLTETEQYFANLFKSSAPPYGLFYLTALERGSVDYAKETTSLSFKTNFHAFSTWFDLVPAAVLQAVRDGLDATGRKNDWGLASWPRSTVTNLNAFGDRRNEFAVVFELMNSKKEVIGKQSLTLRGNWSFNFSSAKSVSLNYPQENTFQTVTFSAVNANKITDSLTIRVASVNGADPQKATRSGSLQIEALSAFPPADFEFSRGVITKYTGSGGTVVIPAAIWGEPVKIGNNALEGKKITGVTISNGVTNIGYRAFHNCTNLTSVTIPSSVTSIEASAFAGCDRLRSVTISDGVTSIGETAFMSDSLTSVTIPGSVTTIGKSAFSYNQLTSVTIPKSVTIGADAFFDNQLTSITIGANVTIGNGNKDRFTDFATHYTKNGKKAGAYEHDGKSWSFKPR
jgi:hypothetical protein